MRAWKVLLSVLYMTLFLQAKVIKNEELISNDIKAKITYEVLENKVKIKVIATNLKVNAKGGISVSFPYLKDTKRIVQMSHKSCNSIKAYKSGSKLWSGNIKKTILSRYLLVEGWSNKWLKSSSKEITIVLDTKELDNLIFFVRVALVKNKQEILIPNGYGVYDEHGFIQQFRLNANSINEYGVYDQQGYLVKQIHINLNQTNITDIGKTESQALKTMINKKHSYTPILVTKVDNYLVTYSDQDNILKFWDRSTMKLLKEFTEFDELLQIVKNDNDLYFLRKGAFGKIALKNLKFTQIYPSKKTDYDNIFFENEIIISNHMFYLGFSGTNGWGGRIVKYNNKTKKCNVSGIGLPHAYFMPKLKLSKDKKYFYLKSSFVNYWFRINVGDEHFDFFEKHKKYYPKERDFYHYIDNSIKIGKASKASNHYINQVFTKSKAIPKNLEKIKFRYKQSSRKDIYIRHQRFKDDYETPNEKLILHNGKKKKVLLSGIMNIASSFSSKHK